MIRRAAFLILSLGSVLGGAALSGCSTVPPANEGREGLLDRLGEPASVSKLREPAALPEAFRNASFRWPLKNITITSPFGRRRDGFHEGIDLRAPSGTPVYASDSGLVLYADRRIRGYGKMVVIRHPNGLTTVYAHNSKLQVRKGQRVKRGQRIALSGNSGRSSGPHLHFEVRHGTSPVNPARLLPPNHVARATHVGTSPKSFARND